MKKIKIAVTIFATLLALIAFGNNNPASIKSEIERQKEDTTVNRRLNLDQIVVTGTRTPKRLSNTPILTTIIRQSDIKNAGSMSTMETLFDNVPGIVSTPNPMGNNLRIRGLNSRYILFLVDNERLVSEGAGGNINLDKIDIDNISRIETISGAQSALYGSNAVGSVINFITQKPTKKIEVGGRIVGESNNTWRGKVDFGSRLKNLTTRVNVYRNSSDGFLNKNATVNPYLDYGANINLGYRPAKQFDVNFNGRYFRHETFNTANVMSVFHPVTHNISLSANAGFITKDAKNSFRASIHVDDYKNMSLEEETKTESRLDEAGLFSARFIHTFKHSKKYEMVNGVEFNHEENFANSVFGVTPTTKSMNDASIFTQAEYKPIEKLSIVAGARYTYNRNYKSAFNPKIALMYKLGSFKLRGGVGTAFRAPSIKELYYNFNHGGGGGFFVYGNPNLKAEKGTYSSLSLEYTKSRINGSVSVYYNSIKDKIDSYLKIASYNERHYINVNNATLKGVDINVTYLPINELLLKANYSYSDAIDNSTGLQLSSNVAHSGTFSATWTDEIFHSPFSIQVAGRVNSPILYQQSVVPENGGPNEIIKDQSKPYSIWKVVINKPFKIKKHNINLTLKADNIFNFEDKSFVSPGRQFLVGLRYRFR